MEEVAERIWDFFDRQLGSFLSVQRSGFCRSGQMSRSPSRTAAQLEPGLRSLLLDRSPMLALCHKAMPCDWIMRGCDRRMSSNVGQLSS